MRKSKIFVVFMAFLLLISVLPVAAESTSGSTPGSYPVDYHITYEVTTGGRLEGETDEYVGEYEHIQNPPTAVAIGGLYRFLYWEDQFGNREDEATDFIATAHLVLTAVFELVVDIGTDTGLAEDLAAQVETGSIFVPGNLLVGNDDSADEPVVVFFVDYDAGEHGGLAGFESEMVERGAVPANPPNVDSDQGYVFIGWRDNLGNFSDDATTFVIWMDTVLTALYEEGEEEEEPLARHRVWFLQAASGGLVDGDTFEFVDHGQKPSVNVMVDVWDGYEFIGWSDGSQIYTSVLNYIITEDTAFTAVFDLVDEVAVQGDEDDGMIRIVYDIGGQHQVIGDYSEEIPIGGTIQNPPTVIAAEGLVFIGWSDRLNLIDVETQVFSEDTRLFATFSVVEESSDNEADSVELDGDDSQLASASDEPLEGGEEQDQLAVDNDAGVGEDITNDDDVVADSDDADMDIETDEVADENNSTDILVADASNTDGGSDVVIENTDGSESLEAEKVVGENAANNNVLIIVIIIALIILIVLLTILLLIKNKNQSEEENLDKE